MMWKIFQASEIVEFAIKIEQNGYAFYAGVESLISDSSVKELIIHLKNEELAHEKTFRELLSDLTPANVRETYPGEYEEYLKALVDNHVFAADNSGEKALAMVKNEIDALNIAMGFEKDTILFFQELRDLVSEKDQSTIDRLIDEEKSHLRKLAIVKAELLEASR